MRVLYTGSKAIDSNNEQSGVNCCTHAVTLIEIWSTGAMSAMAMLRQQFGLICDTITVSAQFAKQRLGANHVNHLWEGTGGSRTYRDHAVVHEPAFWSSNFFPPIRFASLGWLAF